MPASRPKTDWRDLFMGQVDAELARRKVVKPPHRDYRTRLPLSAAPALVKAAADRGMSVSAYLRRAGLAFAAFDLGLDLDQLLADEPATALRFGGHQSVHHDYGKNHGNWKIEGLK